MLCFRGFAFLIVDLTFHGHWHIFGVRRQPLCSGGFVCLGSNCSFANCVDATVEVVLVRSQNCPPKLDQISTTKVAMRKLQLWDSCQRPLSKMCWEDVAFLVVDKKFHGFTWEPP